MDDELAKQIGKAARAARTALELSQADVAERAEISTEFYGRIERGVTMPSVETLVELATVLEVGADQLLGLDQPRKKKQRAVATQPQEERVLLRRVKGAPRSTLLLLNQVLVELEKAEKRRRR